MPNKIGDTVSVQISIKKITLIDYHIDEDLYTGSEKDEVNFQISQKTVFKVGQELADFFITFTYTYLHNKEKFISITVLSQFKIEGLAVIQGFNEKEATVENAAIPRVIIVQCFSLAISNTRAMLFQNLATSVFNEKVNFGIINPEEIANVLYPEGETFKLDKVQIKST